MEKEKNIIGLTRDCLVEDVLFKVKVKEGDILCFEERKKELVDKIGGSHKNMIIAHRLEKKDGKEGVAEMLYFAGDFFTTTPNYWYPKETVPQKYEELKKISN